MNNHEAIQMMERCRQEINDLQLEIASLKPKAEAYDNIAVVLGLMPKRSQSARGDFTYTLTNRINELKKELEEVLSRDQELRKKQFAEDLIPENGAQK